MAFLVVEVANTIKKIYLGFLVVGLALPQFISYT